LNTNGKQAAREERRTHRRKKERNEERNDGREREGQHLSMPSWWDEGGLQVLSLY